MCRVRRRRGDEDLLSEPEALARVNEILLESMGHLYGILSERNAEIARREAEAKSLNRLPVTSTTSARARTAIQR